VEEQVVLVSYRENLNARKFEIRQIQEIVNGKSIDFEQGIWDIQKQNRDLFWVGTDIGLFKLQRKNDTWYLERFINDNTFNNPVRKIFIDKNNNIWCGIFNQGLVFIPNIKTNQSKQYYLFSNKINDLTTITDNVILSFKLDSEDRFWVGTSNGLNLLNGKYSSLDLSGKSSPQVTFKRYLSVTKENHQLNNNEINCIYENNDGNL
jgi:ligand-binding sensor domain-containing protein